MFAHYGSIQDIIVNIGVLSATVKWNTSCQGSCAAP